MTVLRHNHFPQAGQMEKWEPTSVKALLRLTSQRLGQLQSQKDSKATITRRDIATLLQQGSVGLARAKASNLILEDAASDLLEQLEMYVGVVLENFAVVDQRTMQTPVVIEAVSSIIYGANHTESKELNVVADLLVRHLPKELGESAMSNRDHFVSTRIVKAVSSPPPSAGMLDSYLMEIAKSFGVKWVPEPRREDILIPLSEILDPDSGPVVDLPRLRKLCANGIPDEPSWLRPRIWKLFFGVTPVLKSSWKTELSKSRQSYYDLASRLLEPFSSLPPPTLPLGPLDNSLMNAQKQFSSIPPSLFGLLESEPELSPACPLNESASDEIRIEASKNLDKRLKTIRSIGSGSEAPTTPTTPEIRLHFEEDEPVDQSGRSSFSSRRSKVPKTLMTSNTYSNGGWHDHHSTRILRILFIHSSINPGNVSPHIPALLIPLYTILSDEVDPDDAPHMEADCFWLFENVVGEFAELEDEEGGNVWMKKFGDRLAWADPDLYSNMNAKGLDPSLPHYSYRWLAPLLTQTLPLSSVLLVWDAMFSREKPDKTSNPKLEYLIDFTTGMLVRARQILFRLGKSGRRSPSLWAEDGVATPTSPARAWELSDAFSQGMTFLNRYPVDKAGGIERLLQSAGDLSRRREEEKKATKESVSFGSRLRMSMWKGLTNQMPSPEDSPESSEEEEDTESDHKSTVEDDKELMVSTSTGLGSRLATTVWRGITNQSVMDAPPSPVTPSHLSPQAPSPSGSRSPSPEQENETPSYSLWNYAEKIKDSDAAASLARASSNWRAKAMYNTWSLQGSKSSSPREDKEDENVSLPVYSRCGSDSGIDEPPSRPHFRPVRDTAMFSNQDLATLSSALSSPDSPQSDSGVLSRAKNLHVSLSSLTQTTPQPAKPKAGPKPLLLNSTTLITPNSSRHQSSGSRSDSGQWTGVMHLSDNERKFNRDSQSSISSLSPSDALHSFNRTKRDSDSSSRVVPLNRRSVSPMAHGVRTSLSSNSSDMSSTLSPRRSGWGRVDTPDSPPLASPLPKSPVTVSVSNGDDIEPDHFIANQATPSKKDNSMLAYDKDGTSESDAAVGVPLGRNRMRSKRFHRPSNIRTGLSESQRLRESNLKESRDSSPNSLSVNGLTEEQEAITTPKASSFEDEMPSKGEKSQTFHSPRSPGISRARKTSGGSEGRSRKISAGSKRKGLAGSRQRDSSDIDADDEGYDNLLSAYESEEGPS